MPQKLPDTYESYLVELAYWTSRPDTTIEDAAKRMGISRSKAQDILRWGRKLRLLETTVRADRLPQHVLASQICELYREQGIQQAVVLPGPANDRKIHDDVDYLRFLRHQLGALAAAFVEKLPLKPWDHICLGGGRTLMEFALRFEPPIRELVMRPLAVGGRWRALVHADATAVLQVLLWRLGYRDFGEHAGRIRVLCPETSTGLVKEACTQPEIQALFAEEMRPAVVLTGIGWRRYVTLDDDEAEGPHKLTSSYVQLVADRLSYTKLREQIRTDPSLLHRSLNDGMYRAANKKLFDAHVLTDINRYAIARDPKNGASMIVPGFAEETSLAIHPETLMRWRQAGTRVIAVVGGSRLVHALKVALGTGAFDTVIVDTPLAVQMIPDEARPALYRGTPAVPESPEVELSQSITGRKVRGKRAIKAK